MTKVFIDVQLVAIVPFKNYKCAHFILFHIKMFRHLQHLILVFNWFVIGFNLVEHGNFIDGVTN